MKSSIFKINGVKYWQWRHAYAKVLRNIMDLREPQKRLHKDSDKQIVGILQNNLYRCQLWIAEMKKPKIVI